MSEVIEKSEAERRFDECVKSHPEKEFGAFQFGDLKYACHEKNGDINVVEYCSGKLKEPKPSILECGLEEFISFKASNQTQGLVVVFSKETENHARFARCAVMFHEGASLKTVANGMRLLADALDDPENKMAKDDIALEGSPFVITVSE